MVSVKHGLIKDFGYEWRTISFATSLVQYFLYSRQFLVKYVCPY